MADETQSGRETEIELTTLNGIRNLHVKRSGRSQTDCLQSDEIGTSTPKRAKSSHQLPWNAERSIPSNQRQLSLKFRQIRLSGTNLFYVFVPITRPRLRYSLGPQFRNLDRELKAIREARKTIQRLRRLAITRP